MCGAASIASDTRPVVEVGSRRDGSEMSRLPSPVDANFGKERWPFPASRTIKSTVAAWKPRATDAGRPLVRASEEAGGCRVR